MRRYRELMAAVAYDEATALIVVDVQNDFAHPDGSLSVAGAEAVLPAVNEEIVAARAAGAPVVYTQDWHPPRTPHFVTDGGPWPVHCVAGTWGAAFHEDLVVDGPSVHKGTGGEDGYSGFSMRDPTSGGERSTGLHELLTDRHVSRVVIVGLALDHCVRETALDAVRLGYADVVVPRATTAAVEVDPGDGARAETTMAAAGVTLV
jgi:nicotinamidase/pyrazinamidase